MSAEYAQMQAEMQADLLRAFGEAAVSVGGDVEMRCAAARAMALDYLALCVDKSAYLTAVDDRAGFLGLSTLAAVGALREFCTVDSAGGQS